MTPVQRTSIIAGIISSGTVRAFIAGFTIFLIDIFLTGITIQSFEDFLLVILVILIACVGVHASLCRILCLTVPAQQEYASVVAFPEPYPVHDFRCVLSWTWHAGLVTLDYYYKS